MAVPQNTLHNVLVDSGYRAFKKMVDMQMQRQPLPPMKTVSDIRNATDGMLAMVAPTV